MILNRYGASISVTARGRGHESPLAQNTTHTYHYAHKQKSAKINLNRWILNLLINSNIMKTLFVIQSFGDCQISSTKILFPTIFSSVCAGNHYGSVRKSRRIQLVLYHLFIYFPILRRMAPTNNFHIWSRGEINLFIKLSVNGEEGRSSRCVFSHKDIRIIIYSRYIGWFISLQTWK